MQLSLWCEQRSNKHTIGSMPAKSLRVLKIIRNRNFSIHKQRYDFKKKSTEIAFSDDNSAVVVIVAQLLSFNQKILNLIVPFALICFEPQLANK